jgi:hypothetical protein
MKDFALHILDIAENSVIAGASRIAISIELSRAEDRLNILIKDNGRGMSRADAIVACDPFYTTRTTRKVGLGLSFLRQAVEEAAGAMSIDSEPGIGTQVSAFCRASHIDRKPVGDLAGAMVALIAGAPDIDISLECASDGELYRLDTAQLRHELVDVPLNSPDVLDLVRSDIAEGTAELPGWG